MKTARIVSAALLAASAALANAASTCHGTVNRGSIEDSVQLPSEGANYTAYSGLAVAMGRNHVHSEVSAIMLDAYARLERAAPDAQYVYGETGNEYGGRFRPHRTHQNGLSVDYFVPVRDQDGHAARLPTPASQRFGYDIEFDKDARYGGYSIDFVAMAEHLYQLDLAARARGHGIALVIFDTAYLPRLLATPRGAALKKLKFMTGKPWVRHDEHYHVDFAVPCTR
ncbi:penicillin-insensitive murein endopeptidase [Duganella sp. CF458]|uniref:penicillin-insensitive murein endopeptidase n=1 Tax=Duganella sp. CF458 TaxID=1884368 RepID=UPI0008E3F6D4|nr:penicillin-insensitive murein endopeptidase [Duganella sp. CF458]SFG18016.1 penicillin-insensitive murein endopeptidase [Duganella sp. CF458]